MRRTLGRWWHHWRNGGRYRIIGSALAGGALVLLAVIVWAWATRPPAPYSPIPPGEPQEVTSRVPGVDGPAVRIGHDVKVKATRCNTDDRVIQVKGNRVWQTVLPRGTAIADVFPANPMPPGCTAYRFSNPMPDEVARRTRQLMAQGITPVWRIAGEATPTDPDTGQDGVAVPYTSQNFTIVP